MSIPTSHPRYLSLKTRDKIVFGVKKGITSIHGLIAHGRGEAFDYLLGERTNDFALESIDSASAMLLLAKYPVISVNGNSAILVPKEIAQLAIIIPAKIEVNIFHGSSVREKKIKEWLITNGAKDVLLPQRNNSLIIPYISHNRRYVNKQGIYNADVVFAPLEDGDRVGALVKIGRKVITIDLNPLSRTAQSSTVTIIDNIIRAMPIMIKRTREYKSKGNKRELEHITIKYNNKKILNSALRFIKRMG